MDRAEFLIVGAGIGGLAAALALQRSGHHVRVCEQAPELGEVGAGLSISPTGALGLKSLGLFPEFRELACSVDRQIVRHYATGRTLAEVPRGLRLAEQYGEGYYVIHRADLHGLLARAVRANDPESIETGACFIALEQSEAGVTARFANGLVARADVLIGADGVRSAVRSQLFGPEEVRFTGYVAWRGLVPAERVPPEALDPPGQLFIGPQHLINRYLVRGGRLLNFVAFAEKSGWEEEGWSIPAPPGELAAEFRGWHPHVMRIIEAVPPEQLFKWALCARTPLMRWVAGRAALLGDAAHPILPYLGQGAVLAIEDAVVLGRTIRAAPNIEEALARYEAARVGRARFVVERSRAQAPKFQSDDPDGFHHDLPVDESLGLFEYDPAKVPV